MAVSLKAFKVFVDETTENCYASYKVNRNFIYLITKSRRKLVRNMAKAVRMADIAQRLGISTVSVSKGLAGKEVWCAAQLHEPSSYSTEYRCASFNQWRWLSRLC